MKLQLVILACTFALVCADEEPDKACKIFCPKPPTPKECLSQGLAYVPKMGTKNCCARCAKVSDVTKTRECQKNICLIAICSPKRIEDCKKNQVLVPRDGHCYCCNKCVDYWVKKPNCHHHKKEE